MLRIPRLSALKNAASYPALQRALLGAPKRSRTVDGKSALEEALAGQIRLARLPAPVREYRFHPTRRWRFDFAWPRERVAVEIDGGIWTGGRHTRGRGFIADCEKHAEAQLAGWTVLRVADRHVRNGMALDWVTSALGLE